MMRRNFLLSLSLLFLSGCNQLNMLLYTPNQTGEKWLSNQPFVEIATNARKFILVQPSSTIFVYLLGLIAIAFGFYFLKIKEKHLSRKWWGFALVFWGIGAILAGTSYQAFSYEIKCAGYDLCIWTSMWEILYMIFSVASVNSILLAVSYSSAEGKLRSQMSFYAFANFGIYNLIILIGSILPVKFLISFELMLIFLAPTIIFLLILNLGKYIKTKNKHDLGLSITWLWLGITIGAYYLYYMLGITEKLWEQGIWFSENDVLHIGLIIWMIYIAIGLGKGIEDIKSTKQ